MSALSSISRVVLGTSVESSSLSVVVDKSQSEGMFVRLIQLRDMSSATELINCYRGKFHHERKEYGGVLFVIGGKNMGGGFGKTSSWRNKFR